MGKIKVDDRGRILVPSKERSRLGITVGTEFELTEERGALVLRRVVAEAMKVRSKRRKWGGEAFLDAGEATFGE